MELGDLPLVLLAARAIPTVAEEQDDDPGLFLTRQFLQPARERMRLELSRDSNQHTIIGTQISVDVRVQHVQKTLATLLETPGHPESRIVQHGASMQLGG